MGTSFSKEKKRCRHQKAHICTENHLNRTGDFSIRESTANSLQERRCQYYKLRVFTYEELAIATGNFSNANLLGEGGFAQVYKGFLPITNQIVAIKKLKFRKEQKENELEKEIKVISSAHHRNLVKLVGYCNEESNRLLVLQYVPNNSLRSHLHGGKKTLSWRQRKKIAIGSARGLEYLHDECEPKIIHRDVKTDNILLDAKLNPKLADFGLAKIFPDNVSITHITSHWKGTDCYTDPTGYPSQKVSDKLDVYSFGVVLLELVSGRRPFSEGVSIVDWARTKIDKALESGDYTSLLDPKLEGDYNESELENMILCAAASVFKPSPSRPRMMQIVYALERLKFLHNIWDVDDKIFLRDCQSQSQHVHPYQQRALNHPIIIKEPKIDEIENEMFQNYQPRRFTFKELGMASDGFSKSKLLKESDVCYVYMGVLPSGERVDIKILRIQLQEDEFEKEIKATLRMSHPNVVKLVGYCISGTIRLLVFEFVPNSTLKSHLHGNDFMDWIARMKIAKGSARGLKYLLEDRYPRIIHQDLNPDHIFLDDKLEPKLADITNLKFLPDSVVHIFIDAQGTSCYKAPEWASTRKLTDKSNVYSYGVLLLELINGILLVDFDCCVIRDQLEEVLSNRTYDALVDPKLREYNLDEMTLLITCAAACLREAPSSRPKMSQIVAVLEGTISLNDFQEQLEDIL